jgi:hypothetical protein
MPTSENNPSSGPILSARAVDVATSDTTLSVRLEDGRSLSVPIIWFPRLAEASELRRKNWQLIGRGVGIHWPDVDEDVSVQNLLRANGDLLAYRNGAA